jgi:hypothetical protein
MASSDVDQKYLGRIAVATAETNPLVSKSLYQILGLSVVLARKLFRARKLRKLDTSRDTKSLSLYHHIVWLSREGLSILEVCVLPYVQSGEQGPECQVIAAKLRASFYHIFCLFHNNPPITSASGPSTSGTPTPLSPRDDNGRRRTRSGSGGSQAERRDSTPKRSSRDSKGKRPLLRDPIDSITSDASFLTNPYAGMQPGTSPPPGLTPQLPPGLAPIPPKPSSFLLPAINFIPLTSTYFRAASTTAAALLPGAHPLRLSVAIEHVAFLWDCVHDHNGARQLARRAIRDLRQGEEEGVTDEAYQDAAEMVGILGKLMRRTSLDGTPALGSQASPSSTGPSAGPSGTASAPPLPAAVTANPPPTAPPSAPIPTTPRRVSVLRDPENPPSLEGGPVGGVPSTPSSHKRRPSGSGGSRSTTQANTPRERTRDPSETTQRTRLTTVGVTPPRVPVKDVETPPRPPPKDPPRTTPSSRAASKQNTPSQRTPGSQRTSTSQKPASQKTTTPLRERPTTTATTPRQTRSSSGSRPTTRRRRSSDEYILPQPQTTKISPLRSKRQTQQVSKPPQIPEQDFGSTLQNGFYDDYPTPPLTEGEGSSR